MCNQEKTTRFWAKGECRNRCCLCHKPSVEVSKHICCDGECNHDDCCGKVEANCPNFEPQSIPLERDERDIKAMCRECKREFTTWLSDSNECPECEGEMMFFDYLPTPNLTSESTEMEEWEIEFEEMVHAKGQFIVSSRVVKSFIKSLLSSQSSKIKQEMIKEIQDLMKEFANTLLDKRQSGWDWLIKARNIINNSN